MGGVRLNEYFRMVVPLVQSQDKWPFARAGIDQSRTRKSYRVPGKEQREACEPCPLAESLQAERAIIPRSEALVNADATPQVL